MRNGTGSEGVTKNADRLIEICGVVAICMELPRSADYVDKGLYVMQNAYKAVKKEL